MAHLSSLPCLFVVLSFIRVSLAAAPACYYPDGSVPTDYNYVPCTGSQYSSCCIPAEGDVCMSDGLCYWPSAPYLFRGACTDPTWKSSSCPQYCVNESASSYEELVQCGGTKYCCSDNPDCCSKPNLVFDIGVPSVINSYGSAVSLTTLSAAATTAGLSLITAAASTTNAAFPGTGTGTSAAGQSGTSTGLETQGIAKGTLIGIIAGVVIFLILAAIALTLFFCLRKRSRRANVQPVMSTPTVLPEQTAQRPPTTASNAPFAQADPKYYQPGYGQQGFKPQPQTQTQWISGPPAYQPPPDGSQPYQMTPVGAQGQTLAELSSPVAAPRDREGNQISEMG